MQNEEKNQEEVFNWKEEFQDLKKGLRNFFVLIGIIIILVGVFALAVLLVSFVLSIALIQFIRTNNPDAHVQVSDLIFRLTFDGRMILGSILLVGLVMLAKLNN